MSPKTAVIVINIKLTCGLGLLTFNSVKIRSKKVGKFDNFIWNKSGISFTNTSRCPVKGAPSLE